jgi:hypothetical protein
MSSSFDRDTVGGRGQSSRLQRRSSSYGCSHRLRELNRVGRALSALFYPPNSPAALMLAGGLAALAVVGASDSAAAAGSAAWRQSGQQVAAKYTANWTEPPSGIESGRLSNAPLLGNGDLGVSVGASLPGKPQPTPPPGGKFAVGAAPCNSSDPRQLWAGQVFSSPGTVTSITNEGAPAGQCLSTYDTRPLTMRTCGDGDTTWSYNCTTLQLTAGATSTHPHWCLNADSHSTVSKPQQPGWIELTSDCGPKAEQYEFEPTSTGAAGLLKPVCPPAVPKWQCPGLDGQCLTVISNDAPPPAPVPPSKVAAGALTLFMGANQMWGLREYNRCMLGHNQSSKPGCVNFDGDTTFPRRLGLGGLTISPTNATALTGATFSAEMHIATAEIHARLTSPTASLSVHVVLAPEENIALTEITSNPPMSLTVTSWVLPIGGTLCEHGTMGLHNCASQKPCHPTDDPSVPGCLDGSVGAGATEDTVWAQRQPLGNSSSKPISIAMASVIGGGLSQTCTRTTESAAACIVQAGPKPVQATTVLKSNLDLCPAHEAPGARCAIDPLNATLSRAASASRATGSIQDANKRWWAAFWNASFVELPGDATLERFYYATSYLIGSASREGKVAAGLCIFQPTSSLVSSYMKLE